MTFVLIFIFCTLAAADQGPKIIENGAVNQSISVVIKNADGDPNTAVDPADLNIYVQLDGAHPQSAATNVTAHTNVYDAHADWYGAHMGNGLVRLDIADANLADGAGEMLTYIITSDESDQTAFFRVQLDPPVNAELVNGAEPLSEQDNQDGTVLVDTTIASVTGQTEFTLSDGWTINDAPNNHYIVVQDADNSANKVTGTIKDYVGSTKTVILFEDPGGFTFAATDKVFVSVVKNPWPQLATSFSSVVNSCANFISSFKE